MADDLTITAVGNLTADPELRFTPSGAAVANFTVAHTPRAYDKASGEWKDKETLFIRCSVWREAAENVAESLTKGMKVVVQGKLESRSYDDKEGQRRTNWELDVAAIGPDLMRATAKVTKKTGAGGGSYGSGGGFGGGGRPSGDQFGAGTGQTRGNRRGPAPYGAEAPAADTWGSGSGQLNTDWGTTPDQGTNGGYGEPPF